MKKSEIVDSIKTVSAMTDVLLKDFRLRYHHFLTMKHNNASEFELAFMAGTLCFSTDKVTPKEIKTFDKIFREYSGAKYINSAGQENRWNKVVDRFGDDGGRALNDMFIYVADKASGGHTDRRAANGN